MGIQFLTSINQFDNEKSDEKALNAAVENYIEALMDKGVVSDDVDVDEYLVDEGTQEENPAPEQTAPTDSVPGAQAGETVSGTVASIKTSVNNGNTVYYFEIDGAYYYIAVSDCMQALLVEKGDSVTITVSGEADGMFVPASDITVN